MHFYAVTSIIFIEFTFILIPNNFLVRFMFSICTYSLDKRAHAKANVAFFSSFWIEIALHCFATQADLWSHMFYGSRRPDARFNFLFTFHFNGLLDAIQLRMNALCSLNFKKNRNSKRIWQNFTSELHLPVIQKMKS